jgi:hypothetical protein
MYFIPSGFVTYCVVFQFIHSLVTVCYVYSQQHSLTSRLAVATPTRAEQAWVAYILLLLLMVIKDSDCLDASLVSFVQLRIARPSCCLCYQRIHTVKNSSDALVAHTQDSTANCR